MIGVQNENRVHHPDLPVLRNFTAQFVEKISRQGQIVALR